MFSTTNIIGCFVFDNIKIIEENLFSEDEILKNYELIVKGQTPEKEIVLAKKHHAKPADEIAKGRFLELIKGIHTDKFYLANLLIAKKMIKESVHKDTVLGQAINNIDELDKCANMLAKRLREWYELYNPESSKAIEDHESFINTILTENKEDLLKKFEVNYTMGAELSDEDVNEIMNLAKEIKQLYQLREKEKNYVEKMMKENFPNVESLAGSQIGAKLLAKAGGIHRLSEFPASTLQILGAEKALFRHMKTGSKPPKYGLLINHPMVTNAKKEDKGKVARALANKLAIAAKVDNFKGEFVGDKLKEDLEKKFR